MTTRVKLECPDSSHWHVKVEIRDRVYDFEAKRMTDDWTLAESFVLKQGDSREVYITSTRKLSVEEVEPEA